MTIQTISTGHGATWPALLGSAPVLLLYKHSPACMTSMVALREVQALHRALPDVPVYQVDVIGDRGLSARMAADLRVGHASPQAIIICKGRPIWETSHFRVKASTLLEQLERAHRLCGQLPRADGAA